MKRLFRLRFVTLAAVITAFIVQGCKVNTQNSDVLYKNVKHEEITPIADVKGAPRCKVNIDLLYVDPALGEFARKFNREIVTTVFGSEYSEMVPEQAVEAFTHKFETEYASEARPAYEQQVADGASPEELQGWFNYEYQLETNCAPGAFNTLNYESLYFTFMGGAHPSNYRTWIVVDAETGQRLGYKDFYKEGTEKEVLALVAKYFVKLKNRQHPELNLHTLKDLSENGILLADELVIPENVCLSKLGAQFYYNPYEVSPYSEGGLEVTVPYEEIKQYLKERD